jgi:hypothetical protein
VLVVVDSRQCADRGEHLVTSSWPASAYLSHLRGKVNRMDVTEHYRQAIALEGDAWNAVQKRLPGSAGFSSELWNRYLEAVRAADEAREQMTSAHAT